MNILERNQYCNKSINFLDNLFYAFLNKNSNMFPIGINVNAEKFFDDFLIKKDVNYSFYKSFFEKSDYKFIKREIENNCNVFYCS